jgi:hypothetical protein
MSVPYCVKFVFEGKSNKEFKLKKDKRSALSRKTFFYSLRKLDGNKLHRAERVSRMQALQQRLKLNHVSCGKYVRVKRLSSPLNDSSFIHILLHFLLIYYIHLCCMPYQ